MPRPRRHLTALARLRRRARPTSFSAQHGFVLPTAIIVLFVVTLLTAAAITVATQTSTSTSRDNFVKSELAAAEAGLHVADYRMKYLEPKSTQCIGASELKESGCEASGEALGNGATFSYSTTKALSAGEKCAGWVVPEPKESTYRCVTAEGLVGGVKPGVKVSALVKAASGPVLFPISGIVGLEEFTASGGTITGGAAGSNGKLKISGGAELSKGYVLGPKGEFKAEGGAKANPPAIKRTEAEGPIVAKVPNKHPTAEENEDSRIGKEDEFFTEGKAVNKFSGAPNYELKLSSNSKLVLGGSKYYFCNFFAERNSILQVKEGAKVEIFIDSPERKGSTCPAGTGKFEGTGAFKLENPSKDPTHLLIMVYGKGPVILEHGAEAVQASVLAPEAEVTLKGGTKLSGAVVGAKTHLENGFSFEWNEKDLNFATESSSTYNREHWEQCATEGC